MSNFPQCPCIHCKQTPVIDEISFDRDIVYRALYCNCKITPYMRSSRRAVAQWLNNTTFKQTLDQSHQDALKLNPIFITIYEPGQVV